MNPVRHAAPFVVVSAALVGLLGCATGRAPAAPAPAPSAPPASAPAALAFPPRAGVFESAAGPRTPALKALQGRVPLVHLRRKSLRRSVDPGYEIAVFDDGTLMY